MNSKPNKKRIYLLLTLLASCLYLQAATYNVRDFGAKADGKTIDSPAINRAIEAAAQDGGGTIYLPAGEYACYSIRLKSNIHLYLEQGARIVEVLKQPQNSPIPVEKQVIIIYAVVSGALLDIPANQIGEFEKELFSFVDSVYSDIPESIRTTGKLEDDVKEKLTKAIEECKSKFLSEH